jgi:hypothetical protein
MLVFGALFVAGDFTDGRPVVLTWCMAGIALTWPAALLWLVGAAAVEVAQHLQRR